MSEEYVRKLASARLISALLPIENADRLELAVVDGWKCVVVKGRHAVGELVVYFEVDSFLPVLPEYEFLRKSCFKSAESIGEGFRIKTIKLRGQLSQGLVMPLTEVMQVSRSKDVIEGEDLTTELGVKKYEKPEGAVLSGNAKGSYPHFLRKTDQERIQNIFEKMKKQFNRTNYEKGMYFEVSMKLDGASMQVFHYNGETGVCSRNIYLKNEDDNTFWNTAKNTGLVEKVQDFCTVTGRNLSFQGELMGPAVQGNREGLPHHKFFLFDIWDIDQQHFLTPTERHKICKELDIIQTPILGAVNVFDLCETVEDVLQLAEIPSLNHEVAEGVVFKSVVHVLGDIVHFKAISNRFLLGEE